MVPFAYRDKLKGELDLLQQQGVIAPVTEAIQWCALIAVTPKKGMDQIRICADLSKFNQFVMWKRYRLPAPAEAVVDPDTLFCNHINVPGQQELLAENDEGDYQELSMAD